MKTLMVLLVATLVTGATWISPGNSAQAMKKDLATEVAAFTDCTISVKGEIDHVEYELEITVSDISIWDCGRLKLSLLAALF